MSKNSEIAKELADRPYSLIVLRNVTTDSNGYVYLASNPEIPRCKAQGLTLEEAQDNLDEVRLFMIEHLIDYGLKVPPPAWSPDSTKEGSVEPIRVERPDLEGKSLLEPSLIT